MTLVQIGGKTSGTKSFALFNLGFRPFFLGGAVFGIISMAMWMLVYVFNFYLNTQPILAMQWHAHEMIFGYAMAVISGFLLTAIVNWTGVQTIRRKKLAGLFALWLMARILFCCGTRFLAIAAIFDVAYISALMVAVSHPIFVTKQWSQLGILANLLLLAVANIAFYAGALGLTPYGAFWGIYGGLYLVISLILAIGARVMPSFIRGGVDYDVVIPDSKLIANGIIIVFLLFFLNQLFWGNQILLGYLSLGLLIFNSIRLVGWYTRGIWSSPLLWSMYVAFVFIDLGFLTFALTAFVGISPLIAIHCFAVGGIGIATLSMMARVTLGHTGRRIRSPSSMTFYTMMAISIGAVIRVAALLIDNSLYSTCILVAQIFWISAFGLFLFEYSSVLLAPRVDGQDG